MLSGLPPSGMVVRAALSRAVWALLLSLAVGCGGPLRELHPLSGNELTLFPPERRSPPPLECATGADEQRFACLAQQARGLNEKQDRAGAFAVATPDGHVRALARADSLNRGVQVIDENTRFPVGSVTKCSSAPPPRPSAWRGRSICSSR